MVRAAATPIARRCIPDGTRRRRFSVNSAKRHWYAQHRAIRFARRFGIA